MIIDTMTALNRKVAEFTRIGSGPSETTGECQARPNLAAFQVFKGRRQEPLECIVDSSNEAVVSMKGDAYIDY